VADDVVETVRAERDDTVRRTGVTPEAIYGTIRRAFSMPLEAFEGERLDFSPLPEADEWSPSEGQDQPPPRSGGGVYVALTRVFEYCIEFPMLISHLQASERAPAALTTAVSVLGTISASHWSLRACWYDASRYVRQWGRRLSYAATTPFLDAALATRWLGEFAADAGRDRALPQGQLTAWVDAARGVLAQAGIRGSRRARWFGRRLAEVSNAAELYTDELKSICFIAEGEDVAALWRALHGLELAGNRLCVASAALVTPEYEALWWHLADQLPGEDAAA